MKVCVHCGKTLDEQANFCPYCMKLQEEAMPAPQIRIKKFRGLWVAVPTVLLLIGLVAAILFALPEKKPTTLQTEQSAYDLHAQFGTLLGKKYESVRDFFGTETAPAVTDPFTGLETHYFIGIEIAVLPANGKIYSYTVDYTLSDPPHRYNYRGIDSAASYNDVIGLLGLPFEDSGYPDSVTYAMEQGYLRIFYDQHLKVQKLFFLFPIE